MNVNSITAITEPYPDGQRIVALALEYPAEIGGGALSREQFEVPGRTVTDVYAAKKADNERSESGNYVVISLDPEDEFCGTLLDMDGKPKRHGPRPPRPEGQRPQGGGGPRSFVLPDGRLFRGPRGLSARRDPLAVRIRQAEPITAADGTVFPAWDAEKTSDRENNHIADLFTQDRFEDMDYNFFVPEDLEEGKEYPLVLFIHDAGVIGVSPRITLEQGIGATIWATPEEQKKHKCFILAPQHAKELPIANDEYWCTDDMYTIKRMADSLIEKYPIDTDRIYITGQSMGFMTGLEMLHTFPDFFAAALLPAGHWDLNKVAAMYDRNIWMFASDEDKGAVNMLKLPELAEKLGGHIGHYKWDANVPVSALSELVRSVENDGSTFHLTEFVDDTIWRRDQPDRTYGGGHNGTWHLVYQIEAARDWLFRQVKK